MLLDVLSDPAGDDDPSLNTYLTPASDQIGFIAQAVGNVVSHEAGHFFGNWHVDQFNDQPNLMDQGGNFPLLFGVGPDGIGGTADDADVDFGEDELQPERGLHRHRGHPQPDRGGPGVTRRYAERGAAGPPAAPFSPRPQSLAPAVVWSREDAGTKCSAPQRRRRRI